MTTTSYRQVQSFLRSTAKKIIPAIAICFVITTAFSAMSIVLFHMFEQVYWEKYYHGATTFGDRCDYVILNESTKGPMIPADAGSFTPLAMPYRAAVKKPLIEKDQTLVTRCVVDTSNLSSPSMMSLGMVLGRSYVYVNDQLKTIPSPLISTDFSLLPQEQGRQTEIKVFSQFTGAPQVGMATLLPLFVTDNIQIFELTKRVIYAPYTEHPLIRAGLSLVVLILFSLLWIIGFRFRDISWVAFGSAAVLAQNLAAYGQTFFLNFADAFDRVEAVSNVITAFAVPAALAEFMRYKTPSNRVRFTYLGLMTVLCVVVAFVSLSTFRQFMMLRQFQAAIGILLNLGLLVWTFKIFSMHKRDQKLRSRILVVQALCISWIIFGAAQFLLEKRLGVGLSPYGNLLAILAIACFVVFDLVTKHRAHAEERRLRLAVEGDLWQARAVAKTAQLLGHDIARPFLILANVQKCLEAQSSHSTLTVPAAVASDFSKAYGFFRNLLDQLRTLGDSKAARSEVIVLRSLIEEVTELVFLGREDQKCSILIDIDEAEKVSGVRTLLVRALFNLIENARDASAGLSGSIEIRSKIESGFIRIAVINSGSFIPEYLRDKVFEFGFTSGKLGGSGLGLALVKKIAEDHCGSVRCWSSDDQVTTFELMLPHKQISKELSSPQDDAPKRRAVVGIVDDDEFLTLLLKSYLSQYEVVTWSHPELCLQEAKSKPEWIDLFILDMNFTNHTMMGVDVARNLRLCGYKGPIILASSQTPSLSAEDAALFAKIMSKHAPDLSNALEDIL